MKILYRLILIISIALIIFTIPCRALAQEAGNESVVKCPKCGAKITTYTQQKSASGAIQYVFVCPQDGPMSVSTKMPTATPTVMPTAMPTVMPTATSTATPTATPTPTDTTSSGGSGSNQPSLSFSEILNKGQTFIQNGEGQNKELNATNLVSGLANILTTIGVVVVLAGLLIIGIKYMTATPEEAAKLKSKLVGLVIAGVVIIGAFGIWKLVGTFLENITK